MRSKSFIVAFLLSAVAFPAFAYLPVPVSGVLGTLAGTLVKAASSVIFTMLPFWALFMIGRKLGLWDKDYKIVKEARATRAAHFREFERRYKHRDYADWKDYTASLHGQKTYYKRGDVRRGISYNEWKAYNSWRKGRKVPVYGVPRFYDKKFMGSSS
ncbi:MAG: hypothetical protein IJS09_05730 [Treponema sp.]|nr:hypothetical protein [Treponema sp.]